MVKEGYHKHRGITYPWGAFREHPIQQVHSTNAVRRWHTDALKRQTKTMDDGVVKICLKPGQTVIIKLKA